MNAISDIRERFRLTQAQLAEQLGVSQSAVCRMEKGAIPLSRRTRLALEGLEARARQAAGGKAGRVRRARREHVAMVAAE